MIDFRVKATGVSLDLFPDTAVALEINNPLFVSDPLQGTFTYPLDIQWTDKNRKALGFPESLLNRIVASPSIEAYFYYKGVLFKSGILKILKIVENEKIIVSFISGIGAINDLLSNRKMNSVNYGEDVIFPTAEAMEVNFVRYLPPASTGLHPSENMHLTVNTTFGGITTQFFKRVFGFAGRGPDTIALANAFIADVAGLAAHNIVSVTADVNETTAPYFYRIRFEMEPGATISVNMDPAAVGSGFTYKSSVWQILASVAVQPKADFMKEISLLSYPETNYTFFPLLNLNFYDGNNPDYGNYVNYYSTGLATFTVNSTVDGLRTRYNIVPFPFFVHVFKTIFSEIKYTAKGDFLVDEEILKLVIYNNFCLDALLYDIDTPSTIVLNKWADRFNLKNHVPDLDITQFLTFVKSFFCIGYFVDDSKQTIEIVSLKDVLTSPEYEDLTGITSNLKEIDLNDGKGYLLKLPETPDDFINDNVKDLSNYEIKDPVTNVADLDLLEDQQEKDARLVTSKDQYYALKQVTDGATITKVWSYISENYYDFKVGLGGNPIPLNANTLLMGIDTIIGTGQWIIPVCSEEGSSKEFDLGSNNNDKLRFLIYRGMHAVGSNYYPLGTSGYKDANDTIIGALSLKLDDENYGMNKKFFSDWLQFLATTKPFITKTEFTLAHLMDPKLLNQKKRVIEVTTLINKINVVMTNDRIMPSTVQHYKV